MIFSFDKWEEFCRELSKNKIYSIPAYKIGLARNRYLVLKHDVETDVRKAYTLACIENKYSQCGSYYVQAYLLENLENVEMLKKMQAMGHEISYHYDVLDSCKGNVDDAIKEFNDNFSMFNRNGFECVTVCQHGNPVVERVGYHSNRDFFRNEKVRELFPNVSDIMVNYKEKYETDYIYFSDAGRKFKMIFDPINNDIYKSDDKNVAYDNLDLLLNEIIYNSNNNIISTHPHRWTKSKVRYVVKLFIFKAIRCIAKIAIKIPFMKKIMDRYYYLAKKI